MASICTGSFVLAAAGPLDGRSATTHWQSAERFRELYPQVDLDLDVLYTDDSDILAAAVAQSGFSPPVPPARRLSNISNSLSPWTSSRRASR
jgi:transcriptional regulator GlxA family with amidase domain